MARRRSIWRDFMRGLNLKFDCAITDDYMGFGEITCELDQGHKGLHYRYKNVGDTYGVWVWSTDKSIQGFVESNHNQS